MKAMLELSKDSSVLLNQFIKKVHLNKGKQYQIFLDTGELLTIAVDLKQRADDEEDSIMRDISGFISKDEAIINEPDLYDSNYGKNSL